MSITSTHSRWNARSSALGTSLSSPLELRLFATAIGLACMPLFAAIASAQSAPNTTDAPAADRSAQTAISGPISGATPGRDAITEPADIDRAVAGFTGAEIGEIGGARLPADRRLRLAACATPLTTAWHGRGRSSVKVECAGPQSWRIFIATRPDQQAAQTAMTDVKVVNRGDPITVVVRGSGFSVQHSAEAMEDGRVGEWIAVRTVRGATPIRARIERPGLAIIPAS
ncbi:MAG: flagella basal body P-ring formation protein FlgA [Pseudomonadota bacterium]